MQTPQHYIHELLLHVLSQEDDHYPAATASTLFISEVQHQCWMIRSVSQAVHPQRSSLSDQQRKKKDFSANLTVLMLMFFSLFS